jgi:hypothetical protein
VRCPGANHIRVSAPANGWSWPIIGFLVLGVACLVVFIVVMARRRDGQRRPNSGLA